MLKYGGSRGGQDVPFIEQWNLSWYKRGSLTVT